LRTITKCAPDGSIISTYQEDLSWVQVRAKREQALLECDWRALKDVTLSAAWRDYRQALRDLGVPFYPLVDINFPTYTEDEVPADLAAIPVTKPGSRAA